MLVNLIAFELFKHTWRVRICEAGGARLLRCLTGGTHNISNARNPNCSADSQSSDISHTDNSCAPTPGVVISRAPQIMCSHSWQRKTVCSVRSVHTGNFLILVEAF